MNNICISIILLFSILAFSSNSYGQDTFPVLENPYFGLKPPSLMPKLFDPKIVSPEGRFDAGWFSPDMKEFYFTRRGGKDNNALFLLLDMKTIIGGKNLRQILSGHISLLMEIYCILARNIESEPTKAGRNLKA